VARRAKPENSKPTSRIDTPAEDEEHSFEFSSLPHIADFIEHGQIMTGMMAPAGCVVVAAEATLLPSSDDEVERIGNSRSPPRSLTAIADGRF
jgi:hypothetical protein